MNARRTCVAVRQFRHKFADEPPSTFSPVEFTWEDGSVTTLDVGVDWTLQRSRRPWTDPYASVTGEERERLALQVGTWCEGPTSESLRHVVGQPLLETRRELNEVGELAGLHLVFPNATIVARVNGGELDVSVKE